MREKILDEIEQLPEKLDNSVIAKRNYTERISKYFARIGICSKQQGVELIKQGLVKVNNATITETGHEINPFFDAISIRGQNVCCL